jgi:hypothetical protein
VTHGAESSSQVTFQRYAVGAAGTPTSKRGVQTPLLGAPRPTPKQLYRWPGCIRGNRTRRLLTSPGTQPHAHDASSRTRRRPAPVPPRTFTLTIVTTVPRSATKADPGRREPLPGRPPPTLHSPPGRRRPPTWTRQPHGPPAAAHRAAHAGRLHSHRDRRRRPARRHTQPLLHATLLEQILERPSESNPHPPHPPQPQHPASSTTPPADPPRGEQDAPTRPSPGRSPQRPRRHQVTNLARHPDGNLNAATHPFPRSPRASFPSVPSFGGWERLGELVHPVPGTPRNSWEPGTSRRT